MLVRTCKIFLSATVRYHGMSLNASVGCLNPLLLDVSATAGDVFVSYCGGCLGLLLWGMSLSTTAEDVSVSWLGSLEQEEEDVPTLCVSLNPKF